MSALFPIPIVPPPGIVKTESERVIEGRWSDGDKIRFVKGRPQKIGGNVRVTNTAMSGLPRATLCWRDFLQNQYVAAGTYRKLYAFDSGFALTDITPIDASGTLGANPFTTASGSDSVTVNSPAHGRNPGDTVIYSGAATFDNIDMNGTFLVDTVIDSNNYTVLATTTANASGTGGGAAVAYEYEIPVGTEYGAYGQGFGVGQFGLGTFGTARPGSTVFYEPRVWTLGHFGEVMLATYNGGTLFAFDPTQSEPWPRAVKTFGGTAMNAPTDARAMFITPERFVVLLRDKMVLSACSQGDPTAWTPATTNTAFSRTLQEGTKLVGGRVLAPFISLVWSDAALYVLQYTGSQFIYNSSLAGKDCGLISPSAAVTVDGVAFWQGADNFYFYDGAVHPMPNVEDIRKYVFDAIPANLAFQCCAIYVAKYHEIWFFYPTTGASYPTNYVIYSINDQCWAPGNADFYSSSGVVAGRCSGSHFTQGDTSPIMAGSDGYLYNHDPIGDTFNDNGTALSWSAVLAPYALQEGLTMMQTESILLDFMDQSGDISVRVEGWDRLTDAAAIDTDTEVYPASLGGITDMRVTGRYLKLSISQNALGGYMRFGKPVAFARQSGRRT